ncbi:MAG: hypothetical protein PVF63_06735 [Gammaproteobacteria bacterium]|jgi:hypothetical protein
MKQSVIRGAGVGCLALVIAGSPVFAQSEDPFAAFLGTWSGVFTTQDSDFWGLEDFTCFPGCSRAGYEQTIGVLSDPANDDLPFGAIMGMSGQFANEHLQTVLTPIGRQIQQANTNENDPKLYCQPYGYVRQVTNPLPMRITRDGDQLLFRYEEWSLLRAAYTDGRPRPQYMTPTMLGHAVARIEDGAMIIETTGVLPDRISDFTQGGYTGALTGIERYTVHDDPRRLELELTLTDPIVFTEPYVMTKTWLYTPDVELVQDSCGDYPGKF